MPLNFPCGCIAVDTVLAGETSPPDQRKIENSRPHRCKIGWRRNLPSDPTKSGHISREQVRANKTDANDADGLAHLAEVGFYREVRVSPHHW